MTKRLSIFAAVTALAALLSGCYPTGEISLSDKSDVSSSTQQASQQEFAPVKKLTITAALPETPQAEINAITLSFRKWDNAAVKKELIGDEKIAKEQHTQSDLFPDEEILVYDTEGGWRLILETGRVTFENKALVNERDYGLFYTAIRQTELKNTSAELDDFTRDEAVETVKNYLKRLDIKNYGEPDIFAISCDTASDFFGHRKSPLPDVSYAEWTKDDEVYIVDFPLQYENIPLPRSSNLVMGTTSYSPDSYIRATVSRDGIVSVRCVGIFDEKYENAGSVKAEIDAEKAQELLVSYYEKRELDPTEIRSCRLVYFPVAINENIFTYSPFWEFEIIKKTDIDIYKEYEYINAKTGIIASSYK